MDTLSLAQRSERMSRVRSKNTKPELTVRRLVHSLGYRYRLHRNDLPGKPDLAFLSRHKLIFVHGCFWHQHPGCKKATFPKNNAAFWKEKLERNQQRDIENIEALEAANWRVLVVWECQTRNPNDLEKLLENFLIKSVTSS